MATQINLSDAFGAYERGAEVGRADKENRRQEELKTLAPQIMAGDEAAYTRGAQIDQKAAQGYQDEHTKKLKQLRAAAQYMKDKLDTGDEVAIQAAWSSGVRPFLAKLVPGKEVPEQWDKAQVPAIEQALAMTAFIDEDGENSAMKEFKAKAAAAGLRPGTPEYENAAKVDLGVNPRAVTGAVKFDTMTDVNGRPRPQRNRPDGKVEVFYAENNQWVPLGEEGGAATAIQPNSSVAGEGDSKTAVTLDGVAPERQAKIAQTLALMKQSGFSEQDMADFVQAQMSQPQTVGAPPPAGNNLQTSNPIVGTLGVGRTKEAEAAAVKAAERAADVSRPAPATGYAEAGPGRQAFIPGGPADPSVIAASNTAKADASNKPLPAKALQLQLEATDALNTAETVDQTLGKIIQQIDEGTLDLSLAGNVTGGMRNYFGYSNDNSVNLAGFKAGLEKMRNDILILNKGVQTEGDATRAMNAILASPNDEKVVRSQMVRLRELNKRAEELQKKKIQIINQNYGRSGDEDGEPATDDVTDLLNKYGQP